MDGWLFTDFQGHDFITKEFLELGNRFCTRRLFYLIPAQGEPVKVLSAIEPLLLEHLPGKKILYQGIEGQKKVLSELLKPGMKIACRFGNPLGFVFHFRNVREAHRHAYSSLFAIMASVGVCTRPQDSWALYLHVSALVPFIPTSQSASALATAALYRLSYSSLS